jgi:DNA-binding protein HU-beta
MPSQQPNRTEAPVRWFTRPSAASSASTMLGGAAEPAASAQPETTGPAVPSKAEVEEPPAKKAAAKKQPAKKATTKQAAAKKAATKKAPTKKAPTKKPGRKTAT